jgi:hypothetical protein
MQSSKLSYFFAGAIVAVVASVATHSLDALAAAQQQKGIRKGTHVNLSPEDYIEILHLINEYPRNVDAGAVRDASWMFSKDAHSTGMTGGAPLLTPADHKHYYGSLLWPDGQAKKAGNRHFNTSPVIIGLPDGTARGSSYMMGVSIKEKGGKPTIDLMGKYEDVYVKTPDGWRIKERIWTSDQEVGSYQDVAPSPVLADRSTWTTRTEKEVAALQARGFKREANGAPILMPGMRPTPDTPR